MESSRNRNYFFLDLSSTATPAARPCFRAFLDVDELSADFL
jgi:hypothetical protein